MSNTCTVHLAKGLTLFSMFLKRLSRFRFAFHRRKDGSVVLPLPQEMGIGGRMWNAT